MSTCLHHLHSIYRTAEVPFKFSWNCNVAKLVSSFAVSSAFISGGRVDANNKPGGIAVFIVLTVGFSSIFYFLIAKSGHVGGGWVRISVA